MIENEKFYSNYARVFDRECMAWSDNRDINKMFVKYEEQYFNEILHYRGYVFLRDVYEHFGWRVTQASIKCGWHRDCEVDDWHVEFTVFESEDENDPDLIIDFNVDGDITKYFK